MAITTTGPCALADIGRRYTFGLGYSLNGTTAAMYGYVMSRGQTWQETSDIQDDTHLSQIASPNSTDRWDRYPRVSQGDWSGGEGQVFFVDPTRYLTSVGLDVFTPGRLTVRTVSTVSATPTSPWLSHFSPLATDGLRVYMGGQDGGTNNLQTLGTDFVVRAGNVGGAGSEIIDLYMGGDSTFAATIDGNIYALTQANNPASTGVVNDSWVPLTQQSVGPMLAEIGSTLYYLGKLVGGAPTINKVTPPYTGGAGTVIFTGNTLEPLYGNLIPFAGGLFFTSSNWNSSNPLIPTSLYTFSGTGTPTQIDNLPGYPVGASQVNGSVYLVMINEQYSIQRGHAFPTNYTLYQVSGSTVTVLDDTRFMAPDVDAGPAAPPGSSAVTRAGVFSDGRFLYVAFPNWGVHVYDVGSTVAPRSRLFANVTAVANPTSNVVVSTIQGHAVYLGGGSGFAQQLFYSASPPAVVTGVMQTSYFDFETPTTTKVFRSLIIELATPLSGSIPTFLSVAYQLDNETGYPHALTLTAQSSNNLVGFFPVGTKGSRISFGLSLTNTNGNTDWPIIRSYSVNATLGRVWKVTADIPLAGQAQDLTGVEDAEQVSGSTLLANIQNTYRLAAGQCVLFVPSPGAASGAEQVNAHLVDCSLDLTQPGPTESTGAGQDASGSVTLTFIEDV